MQVGQLTAQQKRASLRGGARLEGADELRKLLKNLPATLQRKVLRRACRDGAKVVAEEAERLAPKDTGTLASEIKVRAATKLGRGRVGARVVAGEDFYTGDVYYGYFWEFGFWKQETMRLPNGQIISMKRGRGTPTWQPPRPFMRPAIDNKRQAASDVIRRAIESALSDFYKA